MRITTTIVCVLVAVAVLAGGCSRRKSVIVPGGGSVTVEQKGGNTEKVVVQTGKGTSEVSTEKRTVTEKELGVPVYPGSTTVVTGNYQGTGGSGNESMQQHVLSTPDSFDKVAAFYKSHLKNVKQSMNQSMGNQSMAMYVVTGVDGKDINVHIMEDTAKKVTTIQVLKLSKP
jgi:hypothetical protein